MRVPLEARHVLLRNVPYTAWTVDILRVAGEVRRINFIRNPALLPTGSVLLEYASGAHAGPQASLKPEPLQDLCIGGEVVNVEWISDEQRDAFVQEQYAHWPAETLAAVDIGSSYPMHAVILRNLPLQTTASKLAKKLERSYALGVPSSVDWHVVRTMGFTPLHSIPHVLKLPSMHPDSTSAWFLVCLQNLSEAMRLVRSWHRTRYLPQKFTMAQTGDRYVVDAHLLY